MSYGVFASVSEDMNIIQTNGVIFVKLYINSMPLTATHLDSF
jgi:hypothetical protein